MDVKVCDQNLNDLQSQLPFLNDLIRRIKANSETQQGPFLHKLENLCEIANRENLEHEYIIKIVAILKQLKEAYGSKTKTGVAVEQECLHQKVSVTEAISDTPDSTTFLPDIPTFLPDIPNDLSDENENVKVKKDKSEGYSGNSRYRNDRHDKHKKSYRFRRDGGNRNRFSKYEQSRSRDRFERDRSDSSSSSERSRTGHGTNDRYHYGKSNNRSRRGQFDNHYPSQYRSNYRRDANGSKTDNKCEISGRYSRDNSRYNPFNDRSNTVFNRLDTKIQSNNVKLSNGSTEFKSSESTMRHSDCDFDSEDITEELEVRSKQATQIEILRKVSLTSHIPKTELKYKLGLSKQQTTSNIDDDLIAKVVAQTIKMKNDTASLKPKCVSPIVVQQTSATTKIIDESEKNTADVAVTSDRKCLNEVTHLNNLSITHHTDQRLKKSDTTKMIEESEKTAADVAVMNATKSLEEVTLSNNLPIIHPTDPRLTLINRSIRERQNSLLFNSKPPASTLNYSPAIQSKLSNSIHQYPKPGPTPNIGIHFPVHLRQQQYTMQSHPYAPMNVSTPARYPYLPVYGGHNRNQPTPMTYGEYRRSKASTTSEKLKNKTVVNTSSRDISSQSRLDNVYRSGTFSCTPQKIRNDTAKSHGSDTADRYNSSEECGNNKVVANTDGETSKTTDPQSESTSTKNQMDFVTSSSSLITHNESIVMPEHIESALKQLLNPNGLLAILNACGQMLDDNVISRLKDIIQSSNETNEPASIEKCTLNPPTMVKTVATKRRKKNELEKLHEDIRSMFICNEVLSATGRRMCTMPNNAKKELEYVTAIGNKRLVPTNGRRKPLSCRKDPPKRHIQPFPTRKTEKLPGAVNQESRSTQKTSGSTKKAVKTTKAITLSGDTNGASVKYLTRSCSVVSDELHSLSSAEIFSDVASPKRDGTGKRQFNEMDDTQTVDGWRKKRLSQTVTVKNNNPDWHCLNKTMNCQLCEKFVGNSLTSHYVNCHPGNEVFTSRVLPDVADFLRNSKNFHEVERVFPEHTGCHEFKQLCYFCNETKSMSKGSWLIHTAVHTGYYQFKCTDCKRRFAASTPTHACNTIENKIIKESLPLFAQKDVFGYLCDLCNFVRFEKCEMETHLRGEHEGNVTTKFKKVIFLTFSEKKNEIESNVEQRVVTRSRKRSNTMTNLNYDRELRSSKKIPRSSPLEAVVAERNEENGMLDRDTFPSSVDEDESSSVSNKTRSIAEKLSGRFNLVQNNEKVTSKRKGVRRPSVLKTLNEGASVGIKALTASKEKTWSTIAVREDNGTEEIFDVNWESHLSGHSPQVDSVNTLTEAMPKSEDILPVNNKQDSQAEETIFIKCDYLSGDNLSNKDVTVAKAKECSIQYPTKIPILSQLTTTILNHTKTNICPPISSNAVSLQAKRIDDSSVVYLKQWLKIPTLKLQKYCKTMMRDISMFALYKCMDITCAFTTNDTKIMLIHLQNHENYAQINNQLDSTGSPSWLECPYCNEIGDSCLLLLEHIQDEHRSSIFQCPYCFYRSCAAYNVIVHLSEFHKFEKKSVLVCHGKPKEYKTEKTFIEKSRQQYVRPLRCTEDCKKITFVMDHFVQHMKISSTHSEKFKCQFCGFHIAISSAAKHLLCHRIGVLQCIYCHYGTDGVGSMQNHMCISHPSKLPYICVRLMKSQFLTDEHLSSVESTLTVHFAQSVDSTLFRRCPYTEQQLNFLSPTIIFNSILGESEVVPVPLLLNELSASALDPIDILSDTLTNAEILGISSSCLMLSDILSYEDFEREYVSDDYDKYFASQSLPGQLLTSKCKPSAQEGIVKAEIDIGTHT